MIFRSIAFLTIYLFDEFDDNTNMDESVNFSKQLSEAIQKKTVLYDSEELPAVFEKYKTIQGYLGNFSNVLLRKGLIQKDPYKHEKKVKDIQPIDKSPFLESERTSVVGIRLSDYDNTIEFITTYLKFSVECLTLDRIRKLATFNTCIPWTSLSGSSDPNAKALGEIVTTIRSGSDSMTTGMVNDIITHLGKDFADINAKLKELSFFQRERYKLDVRQKIVNMPSFDKGKASESIQTANSMIRKAFPAAFGNKPFYTELIEEIVKEDFTPEGAELRQLVLKKISAQSSSANKQVETTSGVDLHEILMESFRILSGVAPQFEVVISKLTENKDAIEAEQDNFFHRLVKMIRTMFGLPEKPIQYKVPITESITQTTRMETVNIQEFITDLDKRMRVYSGFSSRKNPAYIKINQLSDMKILEFLSKQLAECQKLLILLTALDTYFKKASSEMKSVKIRGMKIELSAIKGTLIKTNQQKAEFVSREEEQKHLQMLGVNNA